MTPPGQVALPQSWFAGDATELAPRLVGFTLVRRLADGSEIAARIVETEAYMPDDPACHAYRRVTERTRVMYGPPGVAYVYLIYGMHHCLNFVTGCDGSPQAVLIRALESPIPGLPRACAGPGRSCKALGIDLALNDTPLSPQGGLYVTRPRSGSRSPPLVATTRIGISQGLEAPWRWYWEGHPAVSVPARRARGAPVVLT